MTQAGSSSIPAALHSFLTSIYSGASTSSVMASTKCSWGLPFPEAPRRILSLPRIIRCSLQTHGGVKWPSRGYTVNRRVRPHNPAGAHAKTLDCPSTHRAHLGIALSPAWS